LWLASPSVRPFFHNTQLPEFLFQVEERHPPSKVESKQNQRLRIRNLTFLGSVSGRENPLSALTYLCTEATLRNEHTTLNPEKRRHHSLLHLPLSFPPFKDPLQPLPGKAFPLNPIPSRVFILKVSTLLGRGSPVLFGRTRGSKIRRDDHVRT